MTISTASLAFHGPSQRRASRRVRLQAALFAAWICLLALLFAPRIVLLPIEGLSSAFRSDILLSFAYCLLAYRALRLMQPQHRQHSWMLLATGAVATIYVAGSASIGVALGQLLLYWTLYQSFKIGRLCADGSFQANTRLRVLEALLLLHCLLHIAYYASGLDPIIQTFDNSNDVEENYVVAGLYGTASMPFQFALYACALYFVQTRQSNSFNTLGRMLIVLTALATGDSRISAGAFILAIFGWRTIVVIPVAAALGSSLPASEKMLSVLSLESSQLLSDPSLLMRLDNIANYQDWVQMHTLLFGAGAQGFLEFSKQYGYPGPLDMLFLRLLSEIGIVGCAVLLLLIVRGFKRIEWRFAARSDRRMLVAWIVFLFLYSLLNEGVIANRSGQLVFLVTGILVGHLRSGKSER